MIARAATAQDEIVGDGNLIFLFIYNNFKGTTSNVLFTGELMKIS